MKRSTLKNETHTQKFGCATDSIRKNSCGKIIEMLSGRVFEISFTDRLTAGLWLPMLSLTICGPIRFDYEDVGHSYYIIVNSLIGQSIRGTLKSGPPLPHGCCYKSIIDSPCPFMGNSQEQFTLSDGSMWKVGFQYECLYKYFPSVIACADQGFVIVDGRRLSARLLRR